MVSQQILILPKNYTNFPEKQHFGKNSRVHLILPKWAEKSSNEGKLFGLHGFWAWVGILNSWLSGSKFTKLSTLNLFVQLLCMRPCWACKKIGPGLLAYVLQPQNKARPYELRPRPVPALDQNQHWFRWTFLTAKQMLHKFHSCLERANFRLPSPRLQLSWGQVRPSWSQVRMHEWQNRCPHDVWKIKGDSIPKTVRSFNVTAAVSRDWVSIIAPDTGEKLDCLDLFCKYCRRVKMNKLFIRNYWALLIKLARADAKNIL